MLGYIRTNANELRLREHEYYKALYCGLCRRMGKCTGQCSRLSLSYDFVFLAAVRISLTNETLTPSKIRCLLHPTKRKHAFLQSNALDHAAYASALLTYGKIQDDLADERGGAHFKARLAKGAFRSAYRRAEKKYPTLQAVIKEQLRALSEYEKSGAPSADRPAEIFGALLGEVFAFGLEGSEQKIAREIGTSVGHWIYLCDAADDFIEDRKKGRYNPYLSLFGNSPTQADWENAELSMTATLSKAAAALDLIDRYPHPELFEILSNILYLGLPAAAKRAVGKNIDKRTETDNEQESL